MVCSNQNKQKQTCYSFFYEQLDQGSIETSIKINVKIGKSSLVW